jgi:hypothetical protein
VKSRERLVVQLGEEDRCDLGHARIALATDWT